MARKGDSKACDAIDAEHVSVRSHPSGFGARTDTQANALCLSGPIRRVSFAFGESVMRQLFQGRLFRGRSTAATLAAVALATAPALAEATVFRLSAADIVFDPSDALFTSGAISGLLTLDNAIAPGQSFGSASITGLTLDLGGVSGDLADIRADVAPGPVQAFGTRSADGRSLSVFDLRFGFSPNVAGCSFVCAGQILIDSPEANGQPSNFIAIDDPDATTLSIIDSFAPSFTAVPEPQSWTMTILGLGGLGLLMRGRRRARPALAGQRP